MERFSLLIYVMVLATSAIVVFSEMERNFERISRDVMKIFLRQGEFRQNSQRRDLKAPKSSIKKRARFKLRSSTKKPSTISNEMLLAMLEEDAPDEAVRFNK
ncbi:uncharacterized protein LOC132196266 [Neocloeon triangulifer]|uniref:uncharacterized protein LOC132196266 n=1 Tax=Neocloeon triangulifer TaxID=2078957 RepID=UPI00286F6977|nr:uncharacterized protein LOC132196266 [Neocloeon triangulifer]